MTVSVGVGINVTESVRVSDAEGEVDGESDSVSVKDQVDVGVVLADNVAETVIELLNVSDGVTVGGLEGVAVLV